MTQALSELLHGATGLREEQLQRLIARSPYTYKTYLIPKKSGGVRTIAQPAKETKFLQHWLISNIFVNLPIHECAAAYKPGASIKRNAFAHSRHSYLTKFDFEAFFGSIKKNDLVSHLSRHLSGMFLVGDIEKISRLSCIYPKDGTGLCLSIGAPSSPVLSNSIMYEFDSRIHDWCLVRKITYTRYADDLTFSTDVKDICSEIDPFIREVINTLDYPILKVNEKKTIHLSKKNQRRVTGVIINNEGELSIGRDRKRIISSLIHRFSLGALAPKEIYNLQGLLGFSKDIEPVFVFRMKEKYGFDLIDAIFKIRKPPSVIHQK
jgi:RNA-directed DNA polymerase